MKHSGIHKSRLLLWETWSSDSFWRAFPLPSLPASCWGLHPQDYPRRAEYLSQWLLQQPNPYCRSLALVTDVTGFNSRRCQCISQQTFVVRCQSTWNHSVVTLKTILSHRVGEPNGDEGGGALLGHYVFVHRLTGECRKTLHSCKRMSRLGQKRACGPCAMVPRFVLVTNAQDEVYVDASQLHGP